MNNLYTRIFAYKWPRGPTVRTVHTDTVQTYLHKHPQHQVLMVGGLATVSSLITRVEMKPEWAERIILCSKRPWYANIHESWKNGIWGQNVNYLPQALREIAINELKLQANSQLNFGQMQIIQSIAYSKLQSLGLIILDEEVKKIVQNQRNEADIIFNTQQKTKDQKIRANLIVNFSRKPRTNFGDISVKNTGELYIHDAKSQSTEPIIIEGMGQNAAWALRDYAEKRPIHILINENEQIRPDLFQFITEINKKIKNPAFHCKIIKIIMKSKLEHEESQDCKEKIILYVQDHISNEKKIIEVLKDEIYSARGLQLNTKLIEGHHIWNVETPGYQIENKINFRRDYVQNKSESIVPPGNLMAVHTGVDHVLGSEIINDYRDIGRIDIWKKRVKFLAKQLGYEIPDNFFIDISKKYSHFTQIQIHDMSQIERVVARAFKEHVHIKIEDNEELSWKEFLKLCGQEEFACPHDQMSYTKKK